MRNPGSQTQMGFLHFRPWHLCCYVSFQESESRNQAENIPVEVTATVNCIQSFMFSPDKAALTDNTREIWPKTLFAESSQHRRKTWLARQEGYCLDIHDSVCPVSLRYRTADLPYPIWMCWALNSWSQCSLYRAVCNKYQGLKKNEDNQ